MMYCDSCGNQVDPIYMEGRRKVTIRGESFSILYKKPVCPHCCEEIYSDEVEMYISQQAKQSYKRRLRMIPSEELAKFLAQSTVSTEELAKKLSCTTRELIGAAKGGIISKELDQSLKKIMKESA